MVLCCLKKNQNAPRSSEHPPVRGGKVLFKEKSELSVLVADPKKLLYTVANPARGLLNRESSKRSLLVCLTIQQHNLYVIT